MIPAGISFYVTSAFGFQSSIPDSYHSSTATPRDNGVPAQALGATRRGNNIGSCITNLALYRFHHYCCSLNYRLRSAAP